MRPCRRLRNSPHTCAVGQGILSAALPRSSLAESQDSNPRTAIAISTPLDGRRAGRICDVISPPHGGVGRAEHLRRARLRAHPPRVQLIVPLSARARRPPAAQHRDRADPNRTTTAAQRRLAQRSGAIAGTGGSPTTSSRCGPRFGAFTTIDGIEPTTTPPNGRSAGQSSSEKSHSRPKQGWRTVHRTRTLRRRHLPTSRPLAVHLLSQLLTAHSRGDPFPACV